MRIAVDLDDVVMEFWKGVCESLNVEFGLNIDHELTSDWEKNEVKNLTIFGEGRTWWDWLQERDWVWTTFKPVPGAIGGIQQLRDAGHYVEALTKKPRWAEWTVWKWLGRWRPPFNTVTVVPSGNSKVGFSDADVLIDDSPENIIAWAETGRDVVVFTRPWNRSIKEDYNILRADDWSEVLTCISIFVKRKELSRAV